MLWNPAFKKRLVLRARYPVEFLNLNEFCSFLCPNRLSEDLVNKEHLGCLELSPPLAPGDISEFLKPEGYTLHRRFKRLGQAVVYFLENALHPFCS